MSVTLWIVLLFLCGVALIFVEFFVPGLILGILGGLCIAASITVAVMYQPERAVVIVLLEAVGLLVVIMLGLYALPRSPIGRAMAHTSTLEADPEWVSDATDESLMGALGEVVTPLRPAGTIRVGDRRIPAVSNGTFIEEGAAVRVVEVHGNRVVVEETA